MIRESSDFSGETSSDAELSDWGKEEMQFAAQMATSTNKKNKRFINLFKLRRDQDQKNYNLLHPPPLPHQNRIEPCREDALKEAY